MTGRPDLGPWLGRLPLYHRRSALATIGGLMGSLAARPAGGARGEEADLATRLVLTDPPAALPEASFADGAGALHAVREFLGRGMVINFWATWCGPCVAEMPALAALSLALARDDIAVLPLSSDRGGAPVVETWLREKGLTALPVLLDPKGAMARAWGVRGLPTTIIVDRQGRDRARLEGAADWSAPAAIALIRRLVAV